VYCSCHHSFMESLDIIPLVRVIGCTDARAAVRHMLKFRRNPFYDAPLRIAYDLERHEKGRLTLFGLETLMRRLGRRAEVEPCSPHRFRRTFALWCLRNGMDLHSQRLLMGHSSSHSLRATPSKSPFHVVNLACKLKNSRIEVNPLDNKHCLWYNVGHCTLTTCLAAGRGSRGPSSRPGAGCVLVSLL